MAGATPGHDAERIPFARDTSLLRNRQIKIIPVGIIDDDLSDLPGARPMLDVVLALNGIQNVVKSFEIDQPLQSIPFAETFDKSRTMLEDASDKIIGHADVENAIRTVCQNINASACHVESLQDVDGRDKPGHDELVSCH